MINPCDEWEVHAIVYYPGSVCDIDISTAILQKFNVSNSIYFSFV